MAPGDEEALLCPGMARQHLAQTIPGCSRPGARCVAAPTGCPKAELLQQGWTGATLPRTEAGAQWEKWSLDAFAAFWAGRICGDQGCWIPTSAVCWERR